MTDLSAAVVVVAMFIAIIRGAEVRLALLVAGAVLAVAAGKPGAWFDAFSASMTQAGLITVILPALGFTAVVRLGHCDEHLVRLVLRPLLRVRTFIIPAAMLAVVLLSIAITSAAAIAAAAGVVLIPAMIALGVRPAMAAAAVIAGTWGPVFAPGSPHPALIGDIAKVPVIEVIFAHLHATIPAAFLYAALLFLVARLLGEDLGRARSAAPGATTAAGDGETNLLRAAMPMLPLVLLVLGVPQLGLVTPWLPKGVTVLQAMVAGTIVTALVARLSPAQVSKACFAGMGDAYAGVIGIIIGAGVFIGGLDAIGSIGRLIAALQHAQAAVPLAALAGNFGIAVLSGSGDAATFAFNKAVLPHAEALGMTRVALGDIAWVSGAIGRGASPVAAATAIAAGYAGVSVFDIARRTAVPAVVTALFVVAILGLFG
jgi:DcuC family C4-dicarboxylate transporter